MFQVVEHAKKQHDVESADPLRPEFVHVQLAVIYARSENPMDLAKAGIVPTIDRHHIRATTFHLEAEPAVPSANVEHALAAKIAGNGELGDAPVEAFQRANATNLGAIRQFEAVPKADLGPQVVPAAHVVERSKVGLGCG